MTRTTSTTPTVQPVWQSAAEPPEPYDLVLLLLSDGRTRRGTWNGKLWWCYDEQQRRSCPVQPVGWLKFPG